MLLLRYSRWDGSQELYSIDAEEALDELSRYLMEGLDAGQSLEWMRSQGFELAGMEFRVMGLDEMIRELRREAQARLSQFNMDETFDERQQRLDEILDREQGAVDTEHGLESSRSNEFRDRRDSPSPRLSERLDRFRDYEWTDPEAEADFQELLDELEDTRRLEEFQARNQSRMQGPQGLDFDEAMELMREIEATSQMIRDLLEGNFDQLDMEQLRELLGEEGAQSILVLRDLEGALERAGYLREGEDGPELTPRAIRRLGELALDDIYAELQRGAPGSHESHHRGVATVAPERTRRYRWGEPVNLDTVGTLRNAIQGSIARGESVDVPLRLGPDDLEVFDTDHLTDTTTVLLLDMSWSMSWSERWPAAKRVAMALDHLIRTRFPRDHFFIVGFYTRARQLHVKELAELSWNMSDPFTNLQEGLQVAQRLIDKHPSPNTQVIVITDGQPTAYFVEGELRVEWPSGYGGTSPRANRETLREVRRITRKGVTINTFMLDDSPELVRFVEAMTRINKGRAFYTTPGNIGHYIMVDYLGKKTRRIR